MGVEVETIKPGDGKIISSAFGYFSINFSSTRNACEEHDDES